ncbi:MAG: hypothetical protein QM811_10620 [Pirellulales bacterium]
MSNAVTPREILPGRLLVVDDHAPARIGLGYPAHLRTSRRRIRQRDRRARTAGT